MLVEKDDIKIFILYVLGKVGYPIDRETLHSICVLDGFITSFDFIECFDELVSSENLVKTETDGTEKFSLSDKGRHVADTLNGKLLNSVRETAVKSALRFLDFGKRGTEIESRAFEKPHGKYEFTCSLREGDESLLEMNVTLDSYKQLEKVKHNFDNNAEYIYRGILSILSGDADYLLK